MLKVHTFNDLSEANLAATWGRRYALGRRAEPFTHSNPYRLLEVSDHFGASAKVPNPPAREHHQLTVTRAYWAGAADAPAPIREAFGKGGPGRLMLHTDEWFDDADYPQYKTFMKRADPAFVLRAAGRADVRGAASAGFYTHRSAGLREIEVVIAPEEYRKLAAGVPYTLHPVNGTPGFVWGVRGPVSVTVPPG
jgi:hypothetical protein